MVHEFICLKWTWILWWRWRKALGIGAILAAILGGSFSLLAHQMLLGRWPSLAEGLGEPMAQFLLFLIYTLVPPIAIGALAFVVLLISMPSRIYQRHRELLDERYRHFKLSRTSFEMMIRSEQARQLHSSDASLADVIKWKNETENTIREFDPEWGDRFKSHGETEVSRLDLNTQNGIDNYVLVYQSFMTEVYQEICNRLEAEDKALDERQGD